jgi:hypothetical protein
MRGLTKLAAWSTANSLRPSAQLGQHPLVHPPHGLPLILEASEALTTCLKPRSSRTPTAWPLGPSAQAPGCEGCLATSAPWSPRAPWIPSPLSPALRRPRFESKVSAPRAASCTASLQWAPSRRRSRNPQLCQHAGALGEERVLEIDAGASRDAPRSLWFYPRGAR